MFKRKSKEAKITVTIPRSTGRFSLGFKISLSITLLIIFLMLVVGINSYMRNYYAMIEEAQNRGWLTARTTGAFAADYLRGNNTDLLGNIVDHLERDPFVKSVAIMDTRGEILVSSDQSLIARTIETPEVRQALEQNIDTLKYHSVGGKPVVMEFTSPIAPRNEKPLGYIWIEADLGYITTHLVDTAESQIFSSVLAILAGLIICRLIILRLIQIPVKELVKATDRLATGDFSSQVHAFNNDELGRLANAFNTMTGHLSILFQSIRSSVNDINQTAQTIINRSEQSDLASKKLVESLDRLQQSTSELQEISATLDNSTSTAQGLNDTSESSKRQQEHLKEIRNASKKMLRYIDRLDSISQQFKFNEK